MPPEYVLARRDAASDRSNVPGHQVEQLADQHQVLRAGQVLVDAGILTGQPDPPPHPLGLLQHVDAGHLGRTGVRLEQGGQHAYGSRLAGAVGPEHPEHDAAAHGQVDPVQSLRLPESFAEPLRPHHEITHVAFRPLRRGPLSMPAPALGKQTAGWR
jgi:hypothetical protein